MKKCVILAYFHLSFCFKQVSCKNDILKDNFIVSNKKPNLRRLCSLLTEAAQMIQNKTKN
jgi:hypothetical protein